MEIKSDKFYSIKQLWRAGAFPWVNSYPSYIEKYKSDRKKRNMLKGVESGEGNSKSIKVKGENVVAFREAVLSGEYNL